MIKQRTLNNVIKATGVGLHTGDKVYITLRPAPVDTGIVFSRTDLDPSVQIKARAENVVDTTMATTLGIGGVKISTVEHLMSAFAGLGIDNAFVDVSAPELPIMDGSAAPFVFLIQSAGFEEQDAVKRFIRIKKTLEYTNGDISCRLEPFDGFRVEYTLVYDHPVFQNHTKWATVDFSTTAFVKEVSRARTFGFLADFEHLRSMDLARGGSLDNAVVVDEYRILNSEGLRLEDEFVKHKILDAIGDLYLLGHSVIGFFSGYKSGHAPNNALLRMVLADPDSYEIVTFDDIEAVPISFAKAGYSEADA
ncbi:MAG: UDP-3-O-acyl-N-acetylglucosamine deacetylase [Gammaproteobacteria bacterium]|nr:UDP-3-O-acyl-N-acetylglucosamine deacetylase [Gammaproteobacteria bacterium]